MLGFAVLLTLVFSFLGTILCALLAGMMLGATRPSKWISIPASLLFPAVIFAVLRAGKTDLAERQVTLVTLTCLGAFWLIYWVAAAVVCLEQRRPGVAEGGAGGGHTVATEAPASAKEALMGGPEPQAEVSLAELQGRWLWEDAGSNGQARKKEIEIRQGRLMLRVLDAKGRLVSEAVGEVTLDNSSRAGQAEAINGLAPNSPHPDPLPKGEGEACGTLWKVRSQQIRPPAEANSPSPCGRGLG